MAHNRFKGFTVIYVDMPDYPEVERFIRMRKATIYINTAAAPGANVAWLIL